MLTHTGTIVLKFMHISAEEQRERLQERLDDPAKHWKFSMSDIEGTQTVEQVPEGVRNAAGGHARLGRHGYRASQLKTHRNLMIATLVREVLKGLQLRHGRLGAGHFTVE